MRVRIWSAFASNNSGSYTLVGSFESAEHAEAAADALREVIDAQQEWLAAGKRAGGEAGEPPLRRFVRAHGLGDDADAGTGDDWPASYQSPPVAEPVGKQVLIHVPMTISMPRVLGEFIYKRGGRVDTELDHAHHPEVVEFEFWSSTPWREQDGVTNRAQFQALKSELLGSVLSSVMDADVAPAWRDGEWPHGASLFVVFRDLVAGVRAVRDCAARHGVTMRMRVTEAQMVSGDPLAAVRGRVLPPGGRWQVVLWSAGSDRAATARALREATGAGLAETMERLADLPAVVLEHIDEGSARSATEQLRNAGADAQALGPSDFVRR